jgi:hypothetical protein
MAESFPISGNIDPKSFPFLLMDLHRQGATGSLKVEGPSFPKALYYRSGRILFGSSNDPKDQLGSILIENGKITAEQLAEVNTKVGPGNPLAKVLAESGYVNQRELGEAARVKVERILSDILGYTTGSFEFEDGVLPKGAVDLKLSTEKLVTASVRRIDDRGFVLRHLDGLTTVLTPRSDRSAELDTLRPDAGEFITALDGRRSVKEAAAAARIDEFDASKIACALLFLGLVDRGAPAGEASAVSVDPELDLAQTAAMAFGSEEGVSPAAASDDPFFVSAEPTQSPVASPFPFPQPEAEPEPVPAVDNGPLDPFASNPAISLGGSEDDVSLTLPGAPAFKEPGDEPVVSSEPTGFAIAEELETTALPVMEPPAEPPVEVVMPAPAPAAFTGSIPAEPFDAEPEPTPTRSRPSKEDLAALDALLNPANTLRRPDVPASPTPSSAGGPVPGPSRSGRWEPQFSTLGPQPRRPARRQTSPWLLVALGVGAIAAIGGGSWYYLNMVQAKPVVPAPAPTPVPTAVAAVATPEATPVPAPTDAAVGTPSPAPVTTVPPTAAPTPVAATPAPTPLPTPVPAPTATPSGRHPAAASPLDNGPVTNARSLMRRGSLGDAAKGFAANVQAASKGAPFTIQLLVACSTETVQKALDSVNEDELYILPVNYQGKACHRVCWGLYDSEGRADSASRRLPGYFRQNGASPKVVRTATLLH